MEAERWRIDDMALPARKAIRVWAGNVEVLVKQVEKGKLDGPGPGDMGAGVVMRLHRILTSTGYIVVGAVLLAVLAILLAGEAHPSPIVELWS